MVTLPGSDEIVSIGGLVPLHDALGTTLATVNSPGTIATQYTYDPFGNVTPSSSGYGTTFGMGGIELDPTGLYHAGVRFYHPTLQRFLSEDPAGYGGGDINLFAYSGSDPVDASDPSGLDSCEAGDCDGGGDGNSFDEIPSIFELFFPQVDSSSSTTQTSFNKDQAKWGTDNSHLTVGIIDSNGPIVIAARGGSTTCSGSATFRAVNESQAHAAGALYSAFPAEAGGSIRGGTYGTVAVQRGFLGLSTPQLRSNGTQIFVTPGDQGLISRLHGPTGPLSVSDIGDRKIQETPGTAFDIYRFPNATANRFGMRVLPNTTINFPNSSGGGCPPGFTVVP